MGGTIIFLGFEGLAHVGVDANTSEHEQDFIVGTCGILVISAALSVSDYYNLGAS